MEGREKGKGKREGEREGEREGGREREKEGEMKRRGMSEEKQNGQITTSAIYDSKNIFAISTCVRN